MKAEGFSEKRRYWVGMKVRRDVVNIMKRRIRTKLLQLYLSTRYKTPSKYSNTYF